MIFFSKHKNQERLQMQGQKNIPIKKQLTSGYNHQSQQVDENNCIQKSRSQDQQCRKQPNFLMKLLVKTDKKKLQKSKSQEDNNDGWDMGSNGLHIVNRERENSLGAKNRQMQLNGGQNQKKDEQYEMGGALNNIISQILDDPLPQFVTIKNNILLILLLLSSYGVYYVVGQFLDVILIAIIAGISYQQARNNFVTIYMSDSSYTASASTITFKKRLAYGILSSLAILSLPWIRKFLSDPEQIMKLQSYWEIISYGFEKKESKMIYHLQLLGGVFVLSILAGAHNIVYFLKKIKLRGGYAKQIIEILFALGSMFIIISFMVITPLVLYRQLIATGSQIEAHIQRHFNCSLMDVGIIGGSSLPHCHQIITGSDFLKQTITELRYQNDSINECISMISTFETEYLARNTSIGDYAEEMCTWVRLGQKANQYFNENTKNMVLSTSTSILKTLFGNLTSLIQILSMCVFNLTTFVTVFYLTVKHFDLRKNIFSDIFTGQRLKLFSQIATLIQATFFIAFQHFFMSFLLLEIFNFSSVNMILSLLLSLMAFIPLFRPWFGILILASSSVLFSNLQMLLSIQQFVTTLDLYSAILLVVVYYYISETIYSINLIKMEIHQIITNMTVLFGIYQFGVVGIFYGPLILILFRCVHRELLRSNAPKMISRPQSNT